MLKILKCHNKLIIRFSLYLFVLLHILSTSIVNQNKYTKEEGNLLFWGDALKTNSSFTGFFTQSKSGERFFWGGTRSGLYCRIFRFDIGKKMVDIVVAIKEARGTWKILEDGSSIYIATYEPAAVYELDKESLTIRRIAYFESETYIWDMKQFDRKLILGTYPSSKVIILNLDSELFTDLGSFTSDEQYVRAVEYYNDKIYAGIGANAMLIEYDINTGIKRNILPPEYSTDSFVYDLFRIEDKLIIGLEPSNKILLYDLKLQGFKLLMEDAVANPGISAISDLPSNYYFRGFGDYIYEFNKKTSEINRLLPAESSMPITGAEIISDEYIAGITRDANYLEIYPDGLVRNYINLGNVGLEPINVNPTDFVANNGILYPDSTSPNRSKHDA